MPDTKILDIFTYVLVTYIVVLFFVLPPGCLWIKRLVSSVKNKTLDTLFKPVDDFGPGVAFGALRFLKRHGKKWTFKYFYLWCYYRHIRVKADN